ncbi:MAG TPA: SRPBCC family protein [Reyranella sp.]|nr:SRPBCC family protein [Reyranella sp.]
MSKHSAVHDTFTLERTYPADRARVFGAFADPKAKERWFTPPAGWRVERGGMEFKVGGKEHVVSTSPDGKAHVFDAIYLDIVPNARIVYVYEMHMNKAKISASLATVEFAAAGSGTKLTITEQGVFLDGYDDAGSRKQGTQYLMELIGQSLE